MDVVLSPKFYWIKKIEIPIKNSLQAKKIAKNIFDIEGEFIYDAFKLNNIYFAVAIPKNLDLKIDKKYINSLRLAQVEFFDYECLEINNKFILKKINDILFCYPNQNNCDKKLNEEINKIKLSNYSVNLDTINIDKSVIILLGMIFIFFNSFFIAGIIGYKKELNKLNEKEQSLQKYNLPLTSFQLDAIYSNLKTVDNKQKLIRKDLEFFSRTPLNKNEEYKKLIFSDDDYIVEINTTKNLTGYFSKRFNIKSSEFNKNLYKAVLGHE